MKRLASLSQKYLRSPRLVNELIGHTNINKQDIVYDIGAGSGIISSALAKRCKQVVAVEIDPRIMPALRKNTRIYPNITRQRADFLDMPLPPTDYKVFANIPFSQSAAIVRKLTQATNAPCASYLVVQREFARKLLPSHNNFVSLLAILIGVEFEVSIKKYLKPEDFMPKPQVTPVLISIIKREPPLINQPDLQAFREFVTIAYGRARTLQKAVARHISRRRFAAFAYQHDLPVNLRPSQLSVEQWVELFKCAK